MTIKVGEKEYCLDGYANTNELQNALVECYQQGRADAIKEMDLTIAYAKGRADAIDEFDKICEEARGHKFGVCDADFVIDVIKAKVKEQLKEQTE